MTLRERIAALSGDRKIHTVNIAGLGDVHMRVMTCGEKESWENEIIREDGKARIVHIRAKTLVRTLCDEKGNRIYKDDEFAILSELPAPVVMALYDESEKLNNTSPADIDELAKN